MGKKVQAVTETTLQKFLSGLTLISALLYLFYHSAMSVLNRIIVYEGVWVVLQEVTLWLAIGSGVLYGGYLLFLHPMKQQTRRDLRKKILSVDSLLWVALLILMFISVASIQAKVQAYDWWEINRDTLLDALGQTLILFPLGCWLARHRDSRMFRYPLHAFTLAFLILEGWVLVRVFTNSPIYLTNGGGIGINSSLSLIINCNRNTTGLWGYCFFFLCLYLTVTTVKALKPVYLLGMLMNLMIIALSMSRASLYSNCLALGLFAALWFLYQKKFLENNKMAKITVSVLLGIAVTAAFYFFDDLLYNFYLKVSDIQNLLGVSASEREFFDQRLSGRTELWMASLKALVYDARSFLFGVSPIGIYSRIDELIQEQWYTHNQILEFGVGCGVPAMILFIVYCVRLFLQSVRTCFASGNQSLRNALPSLCCFLMLMGNMFEATLYGFNYLSGMIFLVACGALNEMSRKSS